MTVTSFTAALEAQWPTSLRWWLKDPVNPAANMEVSMQPGLFKVSSTDPQQIVFPIGSPQAIIMRDTVKMPVLSLPMRFLTDSEFQAFEQLRATGHILLLQAPKEIGQWYIVLGDTKQDQINLATVRGWSTEGLLVRDITISAQSTVAP